MPPPDGCDVCGHFRGPQVNTEADENAERICRICRQAVHIGNRLTQWDWMRPDAADTGAVSALGVNFAAAEQSAPDAFRVGRWIPRRDDGGGARLFREIAAKRRGDQRLSVSTFQPAASDPGDGFCRILVKYGKLAPELPRLHPQAAFQGPQENEL